MAAVATRVIAVMTAVRSVVVAAVVEAVKDTRSEQGRSSIAIIV